MHKSGLKTKIEEIRRDKKLAYIFHASFKKFKKKYYLFYFLFIQQSSDNTRIPRGIVCRARSFI